MESSLAAARHRARRSSADAGSARRREQGPRPRRRGRRERRPPWADPASPAVEARRARRGLDYAGSEAYRRSPQYARLGAVLGAARAQSARLLRLHGHGPPTGHRDDVGGRGGGGFDGFDGAAPAFLEDEQRAAFDGALLAGAGAPPAGPEAPRLGMVSAAAQWAVLDESDASGTATPDEHGGEGLLDWDAGARGGDAQRVALLDALARKLSTARRPAEILAATLFQIERRCSAQLRPGC